jgi:hypothetical protein
MLMRYFFLVPYSGWAWFLSFLGVHFVTATLTAIVSAQLFENSDSFYLWFFWMMTFLTIINFCLTIAAITSKSTRGVLLGLLIFFAGIFLTLFLDYRTRSSGTIGLVSLHPVAAFAFGLQEIAYLEDRGVGLKSSTVESSDYASGYTFSNSVSALITDAILWGILSWYLNRVVKPDYGEAMPWHFPFTASYWCPGAAKSKHSVSDEDDGPVTYDVPFEPVAENLQRQAAEGKSIEIRNLRRTFGDKIAVDGLNLSMYSGSVRVIDALWYTAVSGSFDLHFPSRTDHSIVGTQRSR